MNRVSTNGLFIAFFFPIGISSFLIKLLLLQLITND